VYPTVVKKISKNIQKHLLPTFVYSSLANLTSLASLTFFFCLSPIPQSLAEITNSSSLDLITQKPTPQISPQPSPQSSPQPSSKDETKVQINEVVVKGADGKFKDLIFQTISTKAGGISTRSQLQNDINAVFATGYFSNVQAVPEDTPKGVRVSFVVKLNPVLRQVRLKVKVVSQNNNQINNQNNPVIPVKVIDDIFKSQYGTITNLKVLQENIQKINKWYTDNGYALANITGTPNLPENGNATLEISEGIIEDVKISFVTKEGNDKDAQGKPIVGKTPIDLILKEVTFKPGQLFHKPTAEKDIKRVFDLGLFEDTKITLEPGQDPSKAILIFQIVENDLGDNNAQIIQYQQQLKVAQANQNLREEARILTKIGDLFAESEKSSGQAFPQYQKAISIYEKLKDNTSNTEIGKIYNYIGYIKETDKKYDEAITNFQKALKVHRITKNKVGEAISLNNIANIHLENQQYQKAADNYVETLKNLKFIKEPFWEIITLMNLGLSYKNLEEFDKSINSYNQALSQLKLLENNPNIIKKNSAGCGNKDKSGKKSSLSFGFGTSTKSGTFFSAKISLQDEFKNCLTDTRFWKVGSLFNIAGAYQSTGDYQQAIYSYNDAFELWKALNKESFSTIISAFNDKSSAVETNKTVTLLKPILDNIDLLILMSLYSDLGAKEQTESIQKTVKQGLANSTKKLQELILTENAKTDEDTKQLYSLFLNFFPFIFSQFGQVSSDNTFLEPFFDKTLGFIKQKLTAQNVNNEGKNGENNTQIKFDKLFPVIENFLQVTLGTSKAENLVKSGKKQEAIVIYQQTIDIIDKSDKDASCNISLNGDKPESGGSNFDFCSFFTQVLNPKQQKAKLLNSQSEILISLKQNKQAFETLKKALSILPDSNKKPVSQDDKKNQDEFKKLIESIGKDGNSTDPNKVGNLFDAIKPAFAQGQTQQLQMSLGKTLYLIGKVYSEDKNYQKSLEFYQRSLLFAQASKDVFQEADTYMGMASLEKDRGNFPQAKLQMEKALDTIESQRAQVSNQQQQEQKNSSNTNSDGTNNSKPEPEKPKPTVYSNYLNLAKYLESKQSYYDFYIDLLMGAHNKQPSAGFDILAFQASERSRARSLRAIINQDLSNPQKDKDSRYLELAKVPLLADIQQKILDDNSLLLEYSLGEERSYLWAVSKNSIKTYQLPNRKEIEKLSQAALQRLKTSRYTLPKVKNPSNQPGAISKIQDLEQLSQILLAPVAEQLGTKRLLIVADGVLQYFPFTTLIKPNINKQTATQIKPLIVDHEIVGLPSASLETLLKRENQKKQDKQLNTKEINPKQLNQPQNKPQNKPQKTLAILADPIFSRDDSRVTPQSNNLGNKNPNPVINADPLYERLDGTKQEAAEISALVPESQKSVKLDFDASYKNATSPELSQYRLVHFATHGIFDAERPERSGVVFSVVNKQGELQRSLLSTPEVFKLQLSSDLIVLSGCSTALGKQIKGEGLIGLTGGLMYAGSKSVLSSLWIVSDDGTASLMTNLYNNMLKKGLSPAAALRSAQLEMWNSQEFQAPYYWAAFAIQGNI
jgi:CHAT domain-containing protein